MSVKKYFLIAAGAVSLAASTAMAGGPDVVAPPAPDYSGFYVEAGLGYGQSNWKYFGAGIISEVQPAPGVVLDHETGGFAWG